MSPATATPLAPQQRIRDLLVQPSEVTLRADKGVTWVTDRYVLARADLFKRVPQPKGSLGAAGDRFTVARLREVLARRQDVVGAQLWDTDRRASNGDGEVALVTSGAVLLAVNARVWEGWRSTGLTPRATARGTSVLWFGEVRGREVLAGLVMTVRLIPSALDSIRKTS